ncbi:MAG: hypothetical protein ACLRSD_07440 [Oscillibacter sp.]
MKQRKIVICEGCESCLSEIAAYCWEESGTGRDRPKKERDHAMDEMRYFAVSIAKKRTRRRHCDARGGARGAMNKTEKERTG